MSVIKMNRSIIVNKSSGGKKTCIQVKESSFIDTDEDEIQFNDELGIDVGNVGDAKCILCNDFFSEYFINKNL